VIPSIRNADDCAILERAAEAYAGFERTGELDARLLSELDAVLRSGSHRIRSWGAGWLWELARGHGGAAERLIGYFEKGTSGARLSLVQSIGFGINDRGTAPQPELEGEVLTRGLKDRSAKVRIFSADRANMRGRKDLLPQIDEAIAREVDAKVRASIESPRDYLRDGYRRSPEYDNSDSYNLWVKYRGSEWAGTVGMSVPREVADAVGFAEVARRIRAREENPRQYPGEPWDPLPARES
jgi:hypothetical protein